MVSSIRFLEAGYCKQVEKFVNPESGKWRSIRFPSSVAVIEHPKQGILLFDTGYTPRLKEITKHFPEKIYTLLTPIHVEEKDSAVFQLKDLGIRTQDVSTVILSHFHADHVAGALDFPTSKMVFSNAEYEQMKNASRLKQLRHATLAALLPTDMESRSLAYGKKTPLPELGPDWFGYDLFQDESIYVVPLPGHSIGHIGVYLPEVKGQSYFLIGDAAWLRSSILEKVMPMPLAQKLVFSDSVLYQNTLSRLHDLPSRVNLVPCHCHETLKNLVKPHV